MNSGLKPKALAAVSLHKINPKYPCLNPSPYHSYEPISVVQIYHSNVTPFNGVLIDLLIVPLFKGLPVCMDQKNGYHPQRRRSLDPILNKLNVFTETCH